MDKSASISHNRRLKLDIIQPGDRAPYDAFISYSQGEYSRLAKTLQEGLQSIGKRWEKLALMRVFRDETHLQIGESLPIAVQTALDASAYFILVASPESAQSPWVKFELECFLAKQRPEKVLIVLVGGELTWDENSNTYGMGPSCAFPDLGRPIFEFEPLHLDLRWASSEPSLSLSNPRFRDVVAALAATLRGVPAHSVVGSYIEEQLRLRRNQRINLGFRGFIGFGLGVPLTILINGYSGGVLYSAPMTLLVFPAVGCLGALVCGLGWKGLGGFALGFGVLGPLYMLSGFRPHSQSPIEMVFLFLVCVLGFGLAGAAGARSAKGATWYDGGVSFLVGGVLAGLLWVAFPDWRYDLQTSLFGPWQFTRIQIVALTIFLGERLQLQWIPLAAAAALGGFVFGIRLADNKVEIPLERATSRPVRHATRILQRLPSATWVITFGTLGIALLVYGLLSLTAGFQIRYAGRELRAQVLGAVIGPPDLQRPSGFEMLSADREFRAEILGAAIGRGDFIEPRGFALTLRVRRALTLRGRATQSGEFSQLSAALIDRYTTAEGGLYERFDNIAIIAELFTHFQSPAELKRLIESAERTLMQAAPKSNRDPSNPFGLTQLTNSSK